MDIGGYLETEHSNGLCYHKDAVALNSARNCLEYLLKLRDIKSVVMPDFMCEVVFHVCKRCGVSMRMYQADIHYEFIDSMRIAENEWLYLADYYGFLDSAAVERALEISEGRLIVDEVQGFFRKPWPNADTIYTCRKFFGVPDGAYLNIHDSRRLKETIGRDRSADRWEHILGRLELGASAYYEKYSANEALIDELPLQRMSLSTENAMGRIDYRVVREKRENNYAICRRELDGLNRLRVPDAAGPYMYPLMVEDATGVREALAAQQCYIPLLWPNVIADCDPNTEAHHLASNILPLPIDQRYGDAEMACMIDKVKSLILG